MKISVRSVFRVIAEAGGVPPRTKQTNSSRYLTLDERIQIEIGVRTGDRFNVIAARLGRSPSTIGREVSANAVEAVVSRTRKALADAGSRIVIETTRGIGYQLREEQRQ